MEISLFLSSKQKETPASETRVGEFWCWVTGGSNLNNFSRNEPNVVPTTMVFLIPTRHLRDFFCLLRINPTQVSPLATEFHPSFDGIFFV